MTEARTPGESRAVRLRRLYALRAQLDVEIAEIESAIMREHEAMLRARASAKAAGMSARRKAEAVCGTDSGYYRHLRADPKERACEACRLAHAAAERSRKERARGRDRRDDAAGRRGPADGERGGGDLPGDADVGVPVDVDRSAAADDEDAGRPVPAPAR